MRVQNVLTQESATISHVSFCAFRSFAARLLLNIIAVWFPPSLTLFHVSDAHSPTNRSSMRLPTKTSGKLIPSSQFLATSLLINQHQNTLPHSSSCPHLFSALLGETCVPVPLFISGSFCVIRLASRLFRGHDSFNHFSHRLHTVAPLPRGMRCGFRAWKTLVTSYMPASSWHPLAISCYRNDCRSVTKSVGCCCIAGDVGCVPPCLSPCLCDELFAACSAMSQPAGETRFRTSLRLLLGCL